MIDIKVKPIRLCYKGFSGGVRRMVYYRLYLMAAPEGRFIGFEEIEAADDVDAVRQAEAFCGPNPLELWCGKRKVKSFPAMATAGAKHAG